MEDNYVVSNLSPETPDSEEWDVEAASPQEELTSAQLLPLAQKQQSEVLGQLIQTQEIDQVKDLTHLFNVSQTKRNALRIQALNDVQDALVRQMADRLAKQPDNFNNADIASWMKVVQQVMDTSQKGVDQVSTLPAITYQQTNNTQVNVNVADTLSRESRDRITDAVQKILQNIQNEQSDPVYADGASPLEVEGAAATLAEDPVDGN